MSFLEWLTKQTRRGDLIGDLARDTGVDPDWPPKGKPSRARLRGYFESRGAIPDVLTALDRAWDEWDTQRRAGA